MSSAPPRSPPRRRAVGEGPESTNRVVASMKRHPVVAFTAIAYATSWICWLPLLADRQNWVSWSASTYLHLLGGLGPAVAALS